MEKEVYPIFIFYNKVIKILGHFYIVNLYYDRCKKEIQFRIYCIGKWFNYFFKIHLDDINIFYASIYLK